MPSPDGKENQGHLPELGVSEQIQGVPRGACLLRGQLGGRRRVRPAERSVGQIRGRQGPAVSTWLSSSGESFRRLAEAAFWMACLASSTLPRARSQRADSGRALQVRNGCEYGARSPRAPQCPRASLAVPVHTEPHALGRPLSQTCP